MEIWSPITLRGLVFWWIQKTKNRHSLMDTKMTWSVFTSTKKTEMWSTQAKWATNLQFLLGKQNQENNHKWLKSLREPEKECPRWLEMVLMLLRHASMTTMRFIFGITKAEKNLSKTKKEAVMSSSLWIGLAKLSLLLLESSTLNFGKSTPWKDKQARSKVIITFYVAWLPKMVKYMQVRPMDVFKFGPVKIAKKVLPSTIRHLSTRFG